MTTRASQRLRKYSMDKHSSRNSPLKSSSVPFCSGWPGCDSAICSPWSLDPLQPPGRRTPGRYPSALPWAHPVRGPLISTSITCSKRMLPATSIASTFRMYSSITVRHFVVACSRRCRTRSRKPRCRWSQTLGVPGRADWQRDDAGVCRESAGSPCSTIAGCGPHSGDIRHDEEGCGYAGNRIEGIAQPVATSGRSTADHARPDVKHSPCRA